MYLHDEVSALLDDCLRHRRSLHMIPEVGFDLPETHEYILNTIKELEPDSLETLAEAGVKAVWYAENAKETLAFRADMDALNAVEETGTEYASRHAGKMHGCGHDGHMTVLLLLAKLIHTHRAKLGVNVVLLFQPGEEGYGGAKRMIAAGALQNPKVDRIYGLHVWPAVPKGKIGIRWGAMMAQSCEFDMIAHGLSAHGASPQMGVDAVVSSAELITMLQSAITRSVDPHQDALLTIGRISGGTARNIIADRVEMNATLRVLSPRVYDDLIRRIHAMADGVAMATGASFDIIERVQYPCVDNPRPMVEHLYTYLDMSDIYLVDPVMAAEDFACYQQEVPGVFMFLGVNGGKNSQPLHNCRFDFDEDTLLMGVELFWRLLGI